MIWWRFKKGNSISHDIAESLHPGHLPAIEITGIKTSTRSAAARS
jgi:hypothetical protein